MNLNQIIKISRPKFWFYVVGPFLVGYVAGGAVLLDFSAPVFVLSFIYFLLPANFLVYGVNDLADQDTDALNEKKETKEGRFVSYAKNIFYVVLVFSLVATLGMFLVFPREVYGLFALFIFTSVFYSLPPLRFKSIPFLDFISNILYVLPGFIGFVLMRGNLPHWSFILSSIFWAFAMHLFSAIPDIKPDKEAGVTTTAVFLGYRWSLVLCFLFWALSFIFLLYSITSPVAYIFIIYPLIPVSVLLKPNMNITKIYWYYPYINIICGFILFLMAWFLK